MRVLMLNSSFLPLGIVDWTKAICLLWQGKASVVEESDQVVRSPSVEMKIPSVVKLDTNANHTQIRVRLNKRNILHRDNYTCQYCGVKMSPKQMNLDHVVPASRGGRKMWTNIVACCIKDNIRKADRTPDEAGMKLLKKPQAPVWGINDQISTTIHGEIPAKWRVYLPSLVKRESK